MTESEDGVETRDDSPEDESTVQPLERTAPIYVERASGYVDIRQVQGDPTLYTPAEAREFAEEIIAAAEACEHGADPPDGSSDEEPE